MLRCGDKFHHWPALGSLVYQQASQFWSRRPKSPRELLQLRCQFSASGLPIRQPSRQKSHLHFRLLCCRFNIRQRTFCRGWWSSRGHCCNHGKERIFKFISVHCIFEHTTSSSFLEVSSVSA